MWIYLADSCTVSISGRLLYYDIKMTLIKKDKKEHV